MLLGTLHRSMPSSPLSPHLEALIGRAVLLPRARVGEWGGIHAPAVLVEYSSVPTLPTPNPYVMAANYFV